MTNNKKREIITDRFGRHWIDGTLCPHDQKRLSYAFIRQLHSGEWRVWTPLGGWGMTGTQIECGEFAACYNMGIWAAKPGTKHARSHK